MIRSRPVLTALICALILSAIGFVIASAGAEPEEVQYIVHPGDTLYRIAAMHGVTVRQLASLNGIRNPNRIYIGQVLRIPKKGEAPIVLLETPATGARVRSPVVISGRADVFEGQVSIRILDSRFRPIAEGTATAAMGELTPFRVEIPFAVPYSQWGYIDAYWISPKDGSPRDMVTVRVYLQKTQRVLPTPSPSPSPTPTVPTVTPSPSPTPTAALEPTYYVHPGDTLYHIAVGHRVSIRDIVRRNRIPNPNRIYVGQRLVIPQARPGVILEKPADGSAVSSPITVTGRADTPEGNVVIQVLDRRFRRVGLTTAVGGTLGTYAPFTAAVTYTVPIAQWGYVEAYWQDPASGAKRDAVSARVRLDAAPGPTPETPGVRYHRVRWGETLFWIARRYGVTVQAIAEANGLRNVHRIYAGQRLIIPEAR